jgi:hypothetical protein
MAKPRLKVVDSTTSQLVDEKQDSLVRITTPLPPRLIVNKQKGGVWGIDVDCSDKSAGWRQIWASLGVADHDTANLIIGQIAEISQKDGLVVEGVVQGLHPSDHIEAMLAVQMAAIHCATMVASRRLRVRFKIMLCDFMILRCVW